MSLTGILVSLKMARQQQYRDRVNGVLDYVAEHLDGDLSLAKLAGVAGFSTFHFHRIFQGITGETLHDHVRRVRLERAVVLLRSATGNGLRMSRSRLDSPG